MIVPQNVNCKAKWKADEKEADLRSGTVSKSVLPARWKHMATINLD